VTGVSYWRVEPEEAGQKLLQFLVRRFSRKIPISALQRWIRTGQVRVNGARAKPNTRLECGQEIRIPPHDVDQQHVHPQSGSELSVLHEAEDFLLLDKPAGLPTHPGSGHTDSVATRLKARFAACPWTPTLVHRLDRDTSGLQVVAKSYTRLRELHELWRSGQVRKAYLAWCKAYAPWKEATRITDLAAKACLGDLEKMVLGHGKQLTSQVQVVASQENSSLVLIAPLTGRTHQIRVQLAGQGYPLLGDKKYGGPAVSEGMLLHAWYLAWPGFEYASLPSWPPPYSIANLIDKESLLKMTRGLFL
jgi:23S rRNA pseudouridine955/2504/2580 synthase